MEKTHNQFMIITINCSLQLQPPLKVSLLNPIAKYSHKLISITSIGIAFTIAIGLPRIGLIATAYLLIYAIILYFHRKTWPILLLISVPLLNLTSYSGRYAITEFDSLILLTFGIVWIKQAKLKRSNFHIELKLFLLLICIGIASGLNALSSFPGAEDHYLTVYQQPENIWRVAKSLLYAFFLYLLIHYSDRRETGEIIRNLAIGAFSSIITLMLIIFWEKGVLHAIFSGAPLRSIIGSALYFSIDFRPTALFQTMHTGGGSLDSYIAIMFIFPILLLFGKPTPTAKYIFLIALLTGIYCALATVSRTVIAATTLSTAIIVLFQIYKSATNNNLKTTSSSKSYNFIQIAALLILWTASLIIVQPHMGTEGVLSLPTFTFALAISYYQFRSGRPYLIGIVVLICLAFIIEALFDRIEKGIPTEEVLNKGGILIALIAINTFAFILKFKKLDQLKPLALPLFIFITAATFLSMGFSSASLAKRLAEITQDTGGRQHHWDTIKSTGSDSLTNLLIGNGPGSMPLNYSLAYTGSDYFTIKQIDPASGILSVLGNAQALIQRVTIDPKETYTLQTSLRSEDMTGGITVAICNRNIIIQTTHNGTCSNPKRLKPEKKGAWQDFSIPLSTEALRTEGIFNSLTNFEMHFYRFNEPVEIRHIALFDSKGKQILLNPGFEKDLDYWFWASDFQHLGWHSKNAFLHQYFELGILGLILTLAIIVSITLKTLIKRNSIDLSVQMAVYSLSFSFILLGSFITILDDPQVATFWYLGFLICALLINENNLTIPTVKALTRPTFTKRTNDTKGTIKKIAVKHKNKITLFLVPFFIAITITELSSHYFYNASPSQVLAQIKSSKLENLRRNHSELNAIWSLIELLAPDDDRLNYDGVPQGNQDFFWIKPEISKLVGPKKITEYTKLYLQEIRISNIKELLSSINQAKPGDDIIIAPGEYTVDKRYITVNKPGSKIFPIRIRAASQGEVTINMTGDQGFLISAPFWSFENLTINGACAHHFWCEHAFHIVGNAHHTEIKNNIIKNFNAHIKINSSTESVYPDYGTIISNRLINDNVRQTSNPVTPIDAVSVNNWIVKQNFIADFAKSSGTRVTYGAFFKGGGEQNTFTNNLIVCEFKHTGGVRIGLSFGGGGTGHKYFRNAKATYEHKNGYMTNNVISNCPQDVAIYLNKASATTINNNFIIGGLGVDIRFKESSALITGNKYTGRFKERDGGQIELLANNQRHKLSFDNTSQWPEIMTQVQKTLSNHQENIN